MGGHVKQNDAVDSIVHLAKQFTADEWEAAIVACDPNSILEEASRNMRWVRLSVVDGVPG